MGQTNSRMVGAPGQRVIVLEATKEGTGNLQMAYVQAWNFKGFNDNPEKADGTYYNIEIHVKSQ